MTSFDLAVLGLLLLLAVGGALRGFVMEVFALIAVAGGVFSGIHFGGLAGPMFVSYLDDPEWRLWAGGLTVGSTVWMVLLLIGRIVSKGLNSDGFSPVNRALGLLFGAGRAFMLIAFTTLAGTALNLFHGDWWEKAMTRPLAENGARFIGGFVDIKSLTPERLLEAAGAGRLDDAAKEAQAAVDQMKESEPKAQDGEER